MSNGVINLTEAEKKIDKNTSNTTNNQKETKNDIKGTDNVIQNIATEFPKFETMITPPPLIPSKNSPKVTNELTCKFCSIKILKVAIDVSIVQKLHQYQGL